MNVRGTVGAAVVRGTVSRDRSSGPFPQSLLLLFSLLRKFVTTDNSWMSGSRAWPDSYTVRGTYGSHHRLQATSYRPPATSYRPPATGHRLQATGYRPHPSPGCGGGSHTHTDSCERVLRLAVPPCVVCPAASPDRARCRSAYRGTLCRTGTAHRTAHRTVQRTPSGRPGRPTGRPQDGLQDAHRTPSRRPQTPPDGPQDASDSPLCPVVEQMRTSPRRRRHTNVPPYEVKKATTYLRD